MDANKQRRSQKRRNTGPPTADGRSSSTTIRGLWRSWSPKKHLASTVAQLQQAMTASAKRLLNSCRSKQQGSLLLLCETDKESGNVKSETHSSTCPSFRSNELRCNTVTATSDKLVENTTKRSEYSANSMAGNSGLVRVELKPCCEAPPQQNAWFTKTIISRIDELIPVEKDIRIIRKEIETLVPCLDDDKWRALVVYASNFLHNDPQHVKFSETQGRAILKRFNSKRSGKPLLVSQHSVVTFLNDNKDIFPGVECTAALQMAIEAHGIRHGAEVETSKSSVSRISSPSLTERSNKRRTSSSSISKPKRKRKRSKQRPRLDNREPIQKQAKGNISKPRCRTTDVPTATVQVKQKVGASKQGKERAKPALKKNKKRLKKHHKQSQTIEEVDQFDEYLRGLLYTDNNEPKWEVSI